METTLSPSSNQVFLYLLVNAGHAIEEKGVITIRTGQVDSHLGVSLSCGIVQRHGGRTKWIY